MWELLKAEIEYNRLQLAIAYLLALTFFVTGTIWDWGGVHSLTGFLIIVFIIFIIMIGTNADKEKRERHQCLLPVTLTHRSFARLVFVIGFQLSLFAFCLIIYVTKHLGQDDWTLWSTLSANAIILIGSNIFIQATDLGHFHKKHYRWLFWTLFAIIMLILGLLAFTYRELRFLPVVMGYEVQRTELDVIVFYAVVIMLLVISHTIFIRRKYYLV